VVRRRALLPHPPVLRIGVATTLLWTAGFVAVPVPAGAGIREAVFVASSGLPTGIGATIAIGSRLVFLLADVLGVALTAPWHRRSAATPAAAPEAPDAAQSVFAAGDTVVTTSSRSSGSGRASPASPASSPEGAGGPT